MWCEWVWILECWTYFLVLCTKLLIGLVICQAIFAKYCHNHYWKKRLSGAKRAHLLKDVWLNKFHHKMAIDKKWPFLSFTTATIFFIVFFSNLAYFQCHMLFVNQTMSMCPMTVQKPFLANYTHSYHCKPLYKTITIEKFNIN